MRALRAFCLAAATFLAACAAPFDPEDLTVDVPARSQVAGVPLIQQADFYCGPASIAMVMQWAGAEVTQADVAALSFNPGAEGTYLADMLGASRRLGQLAVTIDGFDQLLAEVDAGHPVIVFQNLGVGVFPVWHYGVVTGYDLGVEEVYLNSGQLDQMVMDLPAFARTWARGENWGLVVLPPDRLPASVAEAEVLRAGAALERVGQYAAAEALYQTGAARWPENWLWPFGLGNARYARGDLRGAQSALQQARRLGPDVPEVRANLATVTREITG
ncbi:MAG: PA2778 family cysteine peptidase [Pseudomonadota bacterium]